MLPLAVVTAMFGVIIYMQHRDCYKPGHKKDFWAGMALSLGAYVILVLYVAGVNLPKPNAPLNALLEKIISTRR